MHPWLPPREARREGEREEERRKIREGERREIKESITNEYSAQLIRSKHLYFLRITLADI